MEFLSSTLEQLLEISGFGCWEWNTGESVIRFDARWTSAMGYSSGDECVEFHSWDQLVHPDDLQGLMDSLGKMLTGETSCSITDYRLLTPSGDYIWILDRAVPGPVDESGRSSLAMGYQMNINQDRLNEERLRLQRKVGDVISSSAGFREALAGTLDVLVGLPPFDDGAALAPDMETGMLEPLVQGTTGSVLMDALAGHIPSEHPFCRSSGGSPVYFNPLPDSGSGPSRTGCACILPVEFNGEMIAIFLCTSSEDEEVPMQTRGILGSLARWIGRALSMILNVQDLEMMCEQTRKDSETRAELLREVNHRVKNNLAAIVGLLYAEERFMDEEHADIWKPLQQDLIRRIQGLAIVHSMLSASKWSPISISKLAQQILDSTLNRTLPPGKELSLSVSTSDARLKSDQAHQFGMLMNELATNTLKYVVPFRDLIEVGVDIEPVEGGVRFIYRDNGPGFPPDVLSMERHNLGLELIRNIVRSVLGGEMILRNDDGAVIELHISRNRIEEA